MVFFCAGRLARVERCDASAGVGCDPATVSRKSPWRARQAVPCHSPPPPLACRVDNSLATRAHPRHDLTNNYNLHYARILLYHHVLDKDRYYILPNTFPSIYAHIMFWECPLLLSAVSILWLQHALLYRVTADFHIQPNNLSTFWQLLLELLNTKSNWTVV